MARAASNGGCILRPAVELQTGMPKYGVRVAPVILAEADFAGGFVSAP